MNTKIDGPSGGRRFLTPNEIDRSRFGFEMQRVGQFLGRKTPATIKGKYRQEILDLLDRAGWKASPVSGTEDQFLIEVK